MTRARHMFRSGRGVRLAGAVALALVAAVPTAFSGASFTAHTGQPGNVFHAGTLTLGSSAPASALLDAGAMRPGTTVASASPLRLTNTGSLSGTLKVTPVNLVDVPASPGLSNVLTLTVQDVTGPPATVYTGALSAFTGVTVGSLASGGHRDLTFALSWAANQTDPAYEAATSSLTLRFSLAS